MYHRAVPSFTTRKRRKFLQRFIMRLWAERLASNPPEENDERSSEQAAGHQENFGDDQGHSHSDVVYGYIQRNHSQPPDGHAASRVSGRAALSYPARIK